MRVDRFIHNDSGAYSLIPASAVDDVIEDGRSDDVRFVEEHRAILQSLVGDATFVARVVVDEPLTEAEQSEWISRVCRPLDLSCGRLLISGGFDPDMIAYLIDDEEGLGSPFVDVPPGKYVVEVLTYLNTMNGRVLHKRWGADAALGAWFRRDHPGRPFPTWLASELTWAAEEDPGYERLWNKFADSVKSGALQVERGPWSWAGVVVHLTRGEPSDFELSEPDPDGFLPADFGLRRPATFPLGLASDAPEGSVSTLVREVVERQR